MRNTLQFLLAFLLTGSTACAQPAPRWFIGPSAFVQSERRNGNISEYQRRHEARTTNVGYGFRAMFVPTKRFSFATGLLYAERTYEMHRSYDHCAFNPPGSLCYLINRYLDAYRYQTMELPLQASVHLVATRKAGIYAGVNWTNAATFKSTYIVSKTSGYTSLRRENEFLSTSVAGLVGLRLNLAKRIVFTGEMTQRILQTQKADAILDERQLPWIKSRWDAWGANVSLLVGVGGRTP